MRLAWNLWDEGRQQRELTRIIRKTIRVARLYLKLVDSAWDKVSRKVSCAEDVAFEHSVLVNALVVAYRVVLNSRAAILSAFVPGERKLSCCPQAVVLLEVCGRIRVSKNDCTIARFRELGVSIHIHGDYLRVNAGPPAVTERCGSERVNGNRASSFNQNRVLVH